MGGSFGEQETKFFMKKLFELQIPQHIEKLQFHKSENIYKRANLFIEKHFEVEEEFEI